MMSRIRAGKVIHDNNKKLKVHELDEEAQQLTDLRRTTFHHVMALKALLIIKL